MALRGTNQEFGRPYNRRLVLELIRLHGPITRSEIAGLTGLTVQTVSTIARELEEQGFAISARRAPKGRGLPPASLTINPEGGHAVGVHVTPMGIEAALVNLAGDVVGSTKRDAPAAAPDEGFEIIGALVSELAALRPARPLLGVGLALPGPFGVESMSFVGPTTMVGWNNVHIRERLARQTQLPAFVETDMAAAALGEVLYGLGSTYSEFYYFYLGVGLGGTMVHDRAVLRGAWGNAGEIGHITAVIGGEPCVCGNLGCLERYLSLEAFGRRPANMSEGQWIERVAPLYRSALVTIENLFDPQTIVLGGLASESMMQSLEGAAANLPNSVAARRERTSPRVVLSQGGPQSVVRGAAALAISGALSPRLEQMVAPEGPRRFARRLESASAAR